MPSLPPWNTAGSYHIHIALTIPSVHKCDPPDQQLAITEAVLSHKCKHFVFDFSFWTDASVLDNGYGTAACISFATDTNPCK
jgi:hypothetical protein